MTCEPTLSAGPPAASAVTLASVTQVVFPNVSATGASSARVEEFLLQEAGVAGLSGTAFGTYGEGYLRFSYANSVEAIQEALGAVAAALPRLEG